MTGAQHKIVGIGWGLAASSILVVSGEPLGSLCVFTSAIGSMIPDIDHNSTKLGRARKMVVENISKVVKVGIPIVCIAIVGLLYLTLFKGVTLVSDSRTLILILAGIVGSIIIAEKIMNSDTYEWAAKHRGLMHTCIVPALMVASCSVLESFLLHGMIGLTVGYVSHLFADMCTKAGIPLLWPLTRTNIHLTNITTDSKACNVLAFVVACLPMIVVILLGGQSWI